MKGGIAMSSNELFKMPNTIFDMNLSSTELTVLTAMYSLRGVCYKNKKIYKNITKSYCYYDRFNT